MNFHLISPKLSESHLSRWLIDSCEAFWRQAIRLFNTWPLHTHTKRERQIWTENSHLISTLSGIKVVPGGPSWSCRRIWRAALFLVIVALKQDTDPTEMHLHLTYFRFVWGKESHLNDNQQVFVVTVLQLMVLPQLMLHLCCCCWWCWCGCQLHLQNAFAVEYTSGAQRKRWAAEDVKGAAARTLFLRHKSCSTPYSPLSWPTIETLGQVRTARSDAAQRQRQHRHVRKRICM